MRVHHLNCGTMCPACERFYTGTGTWTDPARFVAHVLLVESIDGLVLVDTGLGMHDIAAGMASSPYTRSPAWATRSRWSRCMATRAGTAPSR